MWPWALLGSRFWINVSISSLVKMIVKIDFSAFLQILKGSSLELFIIGHCLAKKQLHNSTFFLKSAKFLFWWKRGSIQGFFLLFNNDFNIDQLVFALVIGSIVLQIRRQYLSLLLSVKSLSRSWKYFTLSNTWRFLWLKI